MRDAIDKVLGVFDQYDLEVVLADELRLRRPVADGSPDLWLGTSYLISDFTPRWTVSQLAVLAQRIITEIDVHPGDLPALLAEYNRGSGVENPAKNIIFAANGPKPELVLHDAVSNDVEITRNSEYCLIYDQPIHADGLTFKHLIDWWRQRERLSDQDDRTVGRSLHQRLAASMAENPVERLVFDTYSSRYRRHGFDVPALVPQVYLHYDPYTLHARGRTAGSPLPRQRMDFLMLFSDRQRVVIEIDGRQHYSDADGRANPSLYAAMVAEDRRLRLAGYEVYRFGGKELTAPDAAAKVSAFFDDLQHRMS